MQAEIVERFFHDYERHFNAAIGDGGADVDAIVALYAPEVIGAAPAGVMTARNDETFATAIARGFARYHELGARRARIRQIELDPIDDIHGLAHIGWTMTFGRDDETETGIDFEVHYLVREIDGTATVFGWISGDEQDALRQNGIG